MAKSSPARPKPVRNAKAKCYRILSLDGGGIRGLITAKWLQSLESRLKNKDKRLYEYFDLIAGTSTGAILACAVSIGEDINKIIDLYEKRGRQVFPGKWSRMLDRAGRIMGSGVDAPKYSGKGLDTALQDIFGDMKFGELKRMTMVVAYDVFGRKPIVFKSSKPEHQNLKVWDICRASAAAPTYFPAHEFPIISEKDGRKYTPVLVDGGVVANNPTACAIAEGIRLNSASSACTLDNFIVASFGTGEATRPIEPEEAKDWGLLQWAQPIIDVLFDGASDAVDYIAGQMLKDKHYFRFQMPLHGAYDDMDDASKENLDALLRLADLYIQNDDLERKQFNALKNLLNNSITNS